MITKKQIYTLNILCLVNLIRVVHVRTGNGVYCVSEMCNNVMLRQPSVIFFWINLIHSGKVDYSERSEEA